MSRPGVARALVIEDAPEFQRLAATMLEREGFEVTVAETGEKGLEVAERLSPDLVLIDVVLPGIDGFEVCRRLRDTTDSYIVMVTACDEEAEKIVGLRFGADDYVTKPYSTAELAARISAIRRRPRAAVADTSTAIQDGPLLIDLDAREVRVDGRPLALTRTEFDLLHALVSAPRRVLTRMHLVELVWGHGGADPHVVDVHVGNMRRKVRALDRSPERFVTVRGVGYRYEPTCA